MFASCYGTWPGTLHDVAESLRRRRRYRSCRPDARHPGARGRVRRVIVLDTNVVSELMLESPVGGRIACFTEDPVVRRLIIAALSPPGRRRAGARAARGHGQPGILAA